MSVPGSSRRGRSAGPSSHLRRAALVLLPLAGLGPLMLIPDAGEAQGRVGDEGKRALFPLCSRPVRVTCVVDGDTFWYRGTKIRLAGIDMP